MKVAKYKSIGSGLVSVDAVEDWIENAEEFIRITEPVDVEFVDLPRDGVIPQEVAALDAKIEEIRVAAQEKVGRLEERKAKLLAITYEGQTQ